MDYKKEYLNVIKNNTFSNLPSQEIIDSDVEIAIAIYYNYNDEGYSDDNYDYDYSRITINKFKDFYKVFNKYYNNKSFWLQTDIENYYTESNFIENHPEIFNLFKSDLDFLKNSYMKTKNRKYLTYLKEIMITNEYDDLLFDFYRVNTYLIDENYINHLYGKKEIEKINYLFNIYPVLYKLLPDEFKNKEKYIIQYINRVDDAIFTLSEESQIKYIEEHIKKNGISVNKIKKFNQEIKTYLFEKYEEQLMFDISNQYTYIQHYQKKINHYLKENYNFNIFINVVRQCPEINNNSNICKIYMEEILKNYLSFEGKLQKKINKIIQNNENDFKMINTYKMKIINKIIDNEKLKIEDIKLYYLNSEKNNTIIDDIIKLYKYIDYNELKEKKINSNKLLSYIEEQYLNEIIENKNNNNKIKNKI